MTNPTDNQVLGTLDMLPAYGNEESIEEVLAKRKKTGGRQLGTPNKQKKFELQKTAQLYGLRALATMVEIMEDEAAPPTVRLQAANDIVDRGFGKSRQTVEHSGLDGGEIQSRLIIEFVGQVPQPHSNPSPSLPDSHYNDPTSYHTTIDPTLNGAISPPTDPNAPIKQPAHLVNSPFRNAQRGHKPQEVSDAISRMVQVPVFKKPWE